VDCLLCQWNDADRELNRIEVWQDALWRVTVSLAAPVPGFAYLEPKRHIPYITDLDGDESATLGATLARVTSILQDETEADLVYVTVFGDRNAHLHFNIAPHVEGDALAGGRGMLKRDADPLPEQQLRQGAERVGVRLGS
jgi:diadenosine tetraphosphate (Ap4A) HIT family hydrolase